MAQVTGRDWWTSGLWQIQRCSPFLGKAVSPPPLQQCGCRGAPHLEGLTPLLTYPRGGLTSVLATTFLATQTGSRWARCQKESLSKSIPGMFQVKAWERICPPLPLESGAQNCHQSGIQLCGIACMTLILREKQNVRQRSRVTAIPQLPVPSSVGTPLNVLPVNPAGV